MAIELLSLVNEIRSWLLKTASHVFLSANAKVFKFARVQRFFFLSSACLSHRIQGPTNAKCAWMRQWVIVCD